MTVFHYPGPQDSGGFYSGHKWLIDRIVAKIANYGNVILGSPCGWGKESIVRQAAFLLSVRNRDFQVCFLDLLNIISEEAFINHFSTKILRLANPAVANRLRSKITGTELLTLPGLIAKQTKINILICIGNFQNIVRFDQSLHLQKAMKAYWRNQNRCAFFLYGNQHQELIQIFNTPGRPLFGFGRLYILKNPSIEDLQTSIVKQFFDSDKYITPEAARIIAGKTNQHPFYTRLLVRNTLLRTEYCCTEKVVNQTFEELTFQFSYYFRHIINNLTSKQVCYLRAILDQTRRICSASNLRYYQIGRSSNVARIRESLIRKEIIVVFGNETVFTDPLFEHWLDQSYFRPSHE